MEHQADRGLLAQKLGQIAELEKKHGLLGVRLAATEDARVPGDTAADYVLHVIARSVKLLENGDKLPRG